MMDANQSTPQRRQFSLSTILLLTVPLALASLEGARWYHAYLFEMKQYREAFAQYEKERGLAEKIANYAGANICMRTDGISESLPGVSLTKEVPFFHWNSASPEKSYGKVSEISITLGTLTPQLLDLIAQLEGPLALKIRDCVIPQDLSALDKMKTLKQVEVHLNLEYMGERLVPLSEEKDDYEAPIFREEIERISRIPHLTVVDLCSATPRLDQAVFHVSPKAIEGFAENKSLRELSIRYCQADWNGAPDLRNLNGIRDLTISTGKINAEKAKQLFAIPSLETLCLRFVRIDLSQVSSLDKLENIREIELNVSDVPKQLKLEIKDIRRPGL
ncbi:hypothetical protein GC197_03700 [bacterium]|nr:hypothetical protein [bacterium]